MEVVKVFTLVSLINEVSELLLKSNKQGEGINKKGLIMKNDQNQPEKIGRLILMHKNFSITLASSKLKF